MLILNISNNKSGAPEIGGSAFNYKISKEKDPSN
jgi:hypothetical protein